MKMNFTNYCIFIDKKIQQGYFFPRMILSHVFFDDSLFENDLIFDGEMTKTQDSKWVYLINDMLVHNGRYLGDLNLVKRINLCYQILEKNYKMTDTDVFKIAIKKYFKYDEFDKMINEFIPSRKYTCRGIYFKPLFLKFKDILVNFDNALVCKVERIKYKNVKNFLLNKEDTSTTPPPSPPELPLQLSISSSSSSSTLSSTPSSPSKHNLTRKKFMIRKTSSPDVYELFDLNNNLQGIACVPNMKVSKYLRNLFQNINMVTKIETHCTFSDAFKKWIPCE
jgi:hypothetical protein